MKRYLRLFVLYIWINSLLAAIVEKAVIEDGVEVSYFNLTRASAGQLAVKETMWVLSKENDTRSFIVKDIDDHLWIWNFLNNGSILLSDTLCSEKVVSVTQHPQELNNVYVATSDGKLFHSRDYGSTFANKTLPGVPAKTSHFSGSEVFKTHAGNPAYLLAVFEEKIRGNPKCQPDCVDYVAYYSLDSGDSWKRLLNRAVDCLWAHQSEKLGSQVANDGIYCFACDGLAEDEDMRAIDPQKTPIFMFMTPDFMANRFDMFQNVVGIAVLNQFLYILQAPTPNDESQPSEGVVWVTSNGRRFAQLQFAPPLNAPPSGFTLLDAETGNVFLDIDQSASVPPSGTLYVSNANGTRFTMVADDTERDTTGRVSFTRFAGLDGHLLLNKISQVDSGTSVSLRSVDDGLSWSTITNVEGAESDDCTENCALHFQLFESPASTADAFFGWEYRQVPGMSLVRGVYGRSYSGAVPQQFFISNDGGTNFKAAANSSYTQMAVGSMGSLLVATDGSSALVSYSKSGGKSWSSLSVDKISNATLAGPVSGREDIFFLLGNGAANNSNASYPVVAVLNFKKLEKFPLCSEEDIETWSPTSTDGSEQCFFGSDLKLRRKKLNAECRVTAALVGEESRKACACTRADYECDVGFNLSNEKCTPEGGVTLYKSECDGDRRYQLTGYMKNSLARCEGGLQLEKSANWIACAAPVDDGDSVPTIMRMAFFVSLVALVWILFAVFNNFILRRRGSLKGGHVQLPTGDDDGDFSWGGSSSYKRLPQGIFARNNLKTYAKKAGETGVLLFRGLGHISLTLAQFGYDTVRSTYYAARGLSMPSDSFRHFGYERLDADSVLPHQEVLVNNSDSDTDYFEREEQGRAARTGSTSGPRFHFVNQSASEKASSDDILLTQTSLPTTTGRLVDLLGDDGTGDLDEDEGQ